MKKKILAATLLTVACGAGCAFGLSACGGKDNGGDNTPYLTGCYIEHNGTDQGWGYYNIGEFEYGTAPDLNYKVYAKYSNNTSVELTSDDYSVSYTYSSSGSPDEPISLPDSASGYELGYYHIDIEYNSGSTIIAFKIVGAPRKNINIQMPNSWRYSQTQPAPTLAGQIGDIDLEEVKYGFISVDELEDKDNPTEDEINSVYAGGYSAGNSAETRLLPGEYYMVAAVPASGKFATTRLYRKFTVNKGELTTEETLPTAIDYTYKVYNVGDVTLNNVLSSYSYTAKNHAGEDVTVWIKAVDESKKVNYSTHSGGVTEQVELNLKGYEDRYESSPWEATVTVHKYVFKELLLSIDTDYNNNNKREIRLYNYLSGGGMGYYNDGGIDVYYQGSLLDLSDPNTSSLLEDNVKDNKGYTYTLKLKDKDNHVWSDGTSDDLVLTIVPSVVCPIETGTDIPVSVGTEVSELYAAYPSLVNEVGEWELYMLNGSDWNKLERTDAADVAGRYTCMFKFVTKPEYQGKIFSAPGIYGEPGIVYIYLEVSAGENG